MKAKLIMIKMLFPTYKQFSKSAPKYGINIIGLIMIYHGIIQEPLEIEPLSFLGVGLLVASMSLLLILAIMDRVKQWKIMNTTLEED